MSSILIVEDDEGIAMGLEDDLRLDGYEVAVARDGEDGVRRARERTFDLIVLDLMLPGVDGLDICRMLRAEGNKVPIIMLTARTMDEDKLLALDLGADDYVTKPFSPRELVARVRAVLRRAGDAADQGPARVSFGGFVMDFIRHEVRRDDESIALTPTEFKLLEVLAKEPGRAFTRLELLDRVFGVDYDGMERTVDVHVMNLRKKIETDASRPCHVVTVAGLGYRFEGENAT